MKPCFVGTIVSEKPRTIHSTLPTSRPDSACIIMLSALLRLIRPACARRNWVWRGLLAWALGAGAYHALKAYAPDIAATLPAFGVSAVVYYILKRGRP